VWSTEDYVFLEGKIPRTPNRLALAGLFCYLPAPTGPKHILIAYIVKFMVIYLKPFRQTSFLLEFNIVADVAQGGSSMFRGHSPLRIGKGK